jgi:endonuclease YncB( thermonuclease family)
MQKRMISRLTVYVWIFLLAACQQTATQQEQATTAEEAGYQVIAIKDGDTIEILKDGKPVRIRLYGIDAPEKNQDFGTRAQQYTSSLVFGKLVELEEKGSDRYGRVVGIIYLPDGRSLNEELVSAGFAWHYKAYSKDPKLADLEAGARLARRGLWAGPTPTAPWEFRKSRRLKNKPSAAGGNQENKKEIKTVKNGSASGTVFLCDSKGAGTYHQDRQCRQLKNCKASIKPVSRQAASGQYQRKACRVCAA